MYYLWKSNNQSYIIRNRKTRLCIILPLILILFAQLSCNNKSTSNTSTEDLTEKDGIITINFNETYWDSLDTPNHTIATLDVNEETNKIDISNAVHFEIPSLSSVSIYFWGDFIGVQDTIFYWIEYIQNYPGKGKQRVTEMCYIPKNKTIIQLLAPSSEPMGPVKGYIFILDTDNNNTGTGYIHFEGQSINKKIEVDAAQNTVCYINNSATVEFEITTMPLHEGIEASNFRMYSLDYDSYKKSPYRAICVLNIKKENSTNIFAFSTCIGYWKDYLPGTIIKAYGFAPNFK